MQGAGGGGGGGGGNGCYSSYIINCIPITTEDSLMHFKLCNMCLDELQCSPSIKALSLDL